MESLSDELDKTRDELASRLSALKLEQDLTTKLRDQLTTTTDDKEKNGVEAKGLKNALNDFTTKYDDLTYAFERGEEALSKWREEAESLGAKLVTVTEKVESLEKEKRKWMERSRGLEDVKGALESELTDARNDLASLRREILESERIRVDLESKVEREVVRGDAADNRRSVLESQLEVQREEYLREMTLLGERAQGLVEQLNQARLARNQINHYNQ